ncbi:MAG TPA: alpha-galactosidase, partial [Abditibacterium sp.]
MPSSPDSSIHFDPQTRVFLLRLEHSFYALRVDDDNRLLHGGSGPLPARFGEENLSSLSEYEEPNFVWEQQAARFELPTFGDVSYHDVALKALFPQPAASLETGEAAHLPVRDLRLRYQSHEIRHDAAPALPPQHGRTTRRSEPRETLCLRLQDINYPFFVTLFLRLTPELDIIERWIELKNGCDFAVEIEALSFGAVHLPQGQYELTRTAGTWVREFTPLRQNLEMGRLVLDQQGLNTGHAFNPFYLLNERNEASETAGAVFFGALAFSGNWNLRFEALTTGAVRVLGGYESSDFSLGLAPGERHVTPAFVHGVAGDGWGGASRKLHRFALDYVLPGWADDEFRPVLYNGWEATYFDLSLEGQIALARGAAEVGVELFCVDDGWFGARRSDNAGLGDWTVSADVFPTGLGPLIAEVKQLGMKFGLWVEPEMVNPDSDLYRAHPDWVLHFPGRPRTEGRQQLILDFGRPEVVEYIFEALDTLLREYEI